MINLMVFTGICIVIMLIFGAIISKMEKRREKSEFLQNRAEAMLKRAK